MSENLARKYRPQTFRDLTGQKVAQMVLFRIIHERTANGNKPYADPQVPEGLLFTGPRGSGKTSTARIVAAALNCEFPGERPCTECPSCKAVREGLHPAVLELDAASNGGVDQVRKLQDLVAYDPGGDWRVVILDEAHSMSDAAFNALLKILEEPPPRTVFILVTTEASAILPTVASRCMQFPFRRITPVEIAGRLQHIASKEGISAEPELLAHVAQSADGALRDAINLLDQARRVGAVTLAQFLSLHGEPDFVPWLMRPMVDGQPGEALQRLSQLMQRLGDASLVLTRLVQCLRDVLVLQAGGEITAQGRGLQAREILSQEMSTPRAVAALRVLWQVRSLKVPDNWAVLELVVVMCTEALHPQPREHAVPANGNSTNGSNGHSSMPAAELAALIGGSS